MAVNSRAQFLFAKHVIDLALLPQGGGAIVNMASVQVRRGLRLSTSPCFAVTRAHWAL